MIESQYQRVAEMVSLAMTVPTVLLGIGVLIVWGPASWRAFRSNQLNSHDWFIIGVVISFAGSVLDNIYWSLPWTASFVGAESSETLFSSGVFFNIVFRQTAGIAAAYCHLHAAAMSDEKLVRHTNRLIAISNLLAAGFVAVLWAMRTS